MASWIDFNDTDQAVTECECSKEDVCHSSNDLNVCNCDAVPSVHGWLQDTIRITNRSLLPITGFKYGFMRGHANVSIGKLFCQGGPGPIDILYV